MSITAARRSTRAFAAGLLATAVVTALAAQAVAVPLTDGTYAGREAVAEGHVDLLHVTRTAGALTADIHSDDLGSLAPSSVVFHVKPSVATRTVSTTTAQLPGWPSSGQYYALPQTNQTGQIFAGFGYDTAALAAGSSISWDLTSFAGPGNFAMWQSGDDGPNVLLSSAGAVKAFTSTANHEHTNWGFTAAGTYQVTFTPTVTEPGQAAVALAPQVYEFFVGETLPTDPIVPDPPAGTTLTISGWPTGTHAHYHTGQPGVLTAVADPATTLTTYKWWTLAPGADPATGWEAVTGTSVSTLGFIVASSDAGRQYKVQLLDADNNVVAESVPGTVAIDDHGRAITMGPNVSVTLTPTAGLTVSVPEAARNIAMSNFTLATDAASWLSTGQLAPITITDARPRNPNPGWSVTAQVRGFVTATGDKTLTGKNMGWTPAVASASVGQTVTAGAQVNPVDPRNPADVSKGLSSAATLATAPAGAGLGTAQVGASLVIEAPTTLAPGTYTAMIVFTAI